MSNTTYKVVNPGDGSSWMVVPNEIPGTIPPAPSVPDNVLRFDRIAAELSALYERKNKDYGDSFGRSVEKYGAISALTRISDKFNRLESLILANEKAEINDESLDDTLKDLAAYCIMTLVAREQKKHKGDK